MSLFSLGPYTLSSGLPSAYKIDCDALTDADIECLAFLMAQRLQPFSRVEGVPRGGLKLADELQRYAYPDRPLPLLIVDDVWTTGASMNRHRAGRLCYGAVIFARNPVQSWVLPLFQLYKTRNGD